jgi:hypothetical protein
MTVLHFEGVIRNVHYAPQVRSRSLKSSLASDFDINQAPSQGIVKWDDDAILGYAKWVSPKRTRSYPFARLYQVYHLPKKVAIIPVIKDEGAGGDLDRINFITFSWMNLTNIYIILAWYEHFHPTPHAPIRLQGNVLMPTTFITNCKLFEIINKVLCIGIQCTLSATLLIYFNAR